MPRYTVTVTRPKDCDCRPGYDGAGWCHADGCASWSLEGERHPADAEDEMRSIVRDLVVAAGVAHGTTGDPVSPAGGTIGPLPDGSSITVEADRLSLAEARSVAAQLADDGAEDCSIRHFAETGEARPGLADAIRGDQALDVETGGDPSKWDALLAFVEADREDGERS